MRVMARSLATMEPGSRPVPVLLAFSDIKGLTKPEQLEQPIIEKLKFYQLEQGEWGELDYWERKVSEPG
jgi:hypothetical protein